MRTDRNAHRRPLAPSGVPDGRTDGDGDDEQDDPGGWWTSAYEADDQPWSTGRPQPAIVEAVTDDLDGPLLDVGCGVGEHARHFAAEDVPTVGVDFARPAVERARELARETSLDAEFHVADALALDPALGSFEVVVDVGMFHTLEPDDHLRYAASLAGACLPPRVRAGRPRRRRPSAGPTRRVRAGIRGRLDGPVGTGSAVRDSQRARDGYPRGGRIRVRVSGRRAGQSRANSPGSQSSLTSAAWA